MNQCALVFRPLRLRNAHCVFKRTKTLHWTVRSTTDAHFSTMNSFPSKTIDLDHIWKTKRKVNNEVEYVATVAISFSSRQHERQRIRRMRHNCRPNDERSCMNQSKTEGFSLAAHNRPQVLHLRERLLLSLASISHWYRFQIRTICWCFNWFSDRHSTILN